MRHSISLLICAALLVAGCQTTRYELRPPASDTGRLCVTQCAGNKEACRGNEIYRARTEKEDCERHSERELRACLGRADSPEMRRNCENKKQGCWAHENMDRCEAEYRGCYVQCGGTVTKVVEEY